MKTFTADEIRDLETYASLYLSLDDIAAIFECSKTDLKAALSNTDSPARRAYNKGRALTEVKLRESIVKNAFRGSVPAQNTLLNWIKRKEDIDE
jgi:hypothetical protein